jgi:hypothetical protein
MAFGKSGAFAEKQGFAEIKMQLSQSVFHFFLDFKFTSRYATMASILFKPPRKIVPKNLR